MDTPVVVEMAIESIIPSSSSQLSTALLGIENSLLRAAEANVAQMGEGFTDAEREAMTTIEELKLINGAYSRDEIDYHGRAEQFGNRSRGC